MKRLFYLSVFFLFPLFAKTQNVGIGTTTPSNKLTVNGNLVVTQPANSTNTAPTPAQTKTMVNGSSYNYPGTDSTGRIYDPGGPSGDYLANLSSSISINNIGFVPNVSGIQLTIESIDLGTGDSLIISDFHRSFTSYLRVGNGYTLTGTYTFPTDIIQILFKSNSDASTGSGFSILYKLLYPGAEPAPTNFGASAMVFDVIKCSLSAGSALTNTGSYSTALGFASTSSGDGSMAMGYNTEASSIASVAMGINTTASGSQSTAMGTGTNASANSSTAMGLSTNAASYASTAIGAYNESIPTSNKTTWVAADPLLYVGNGTSSGAAHNAAVIYKNGNADLNGFVRLGEITDGSPRIKIKKITTTTPAIQGGFTLVPHGIVQSKILSVSGLATVPGGYKIIPNHEQAGFKYTLNVDNANIAVGAVAANSGSILNAPIVILVTYEE